MEQLKTIIFTGVSGAGKTTALHAVEDLGFYCVDNLPLGLLEGFLDVMRREPEVDRSALVADARLKRLPEYADAVAGLLKRGVPLELVYLDASDEVLVRRFSQTRRRHPISDADLPTGLREERRLIAPLREQAAVCIDTTELTVHELKQLIQDRYPRQESQLVVSILSFGYRYGVPSQADVVFDVRFLPNPYFVEGLSSLTGKHEPVARYVLDTADAQEFLRRAEDMLAFLLPRYQAEGKVYLTVAVGCTGGRHRSVAIVEALAQRLRQLRSVRVRHRDVERQSTGGEAHLAAPLAETRTR